MSDPLDLFDDGKLQEKMPNYKPKPPEQVPGAPPYVPDPDKRWQGVIDGFSVTKQENEWLADRQALISFNMKLVYSAVLDLRASVEASMAAAADNKRTVFRLEQKPMRTLWVWAQKLLYILAGVALVWIVKKTTGLDIKP